MDGLSEMFKYEKRYHYPHMEPADVLIWERFIEKYPERYDYCQYDVLVGSDPDFDTVVNSNTSGDAWKLYQKKIDVVGFKKNTIDIIEIKPNAGASAIGQVKLYKTLYIKDYSPPDVPKPVIITDKEIRDIRSYSVLEGVDIVVV